MATHGIPIIPDEECEPLRGDCDRAYQEIDDPILRILVDFCRLHMLDESLDADLLTLMNMNYLAEALDCFGVEVLIQHGLAEWGEKDDLVIYDDGDQRLPKSLYMFTRDGVGGERFERWYDSLSEEERKRMKREYLECMHVRDAFNACTIASMYIQLIIHDIMRTRQ